jgi:hypothetical protein
MFSPPIARGQYNTRTRGERRRHTRNDDILLPIQDLDSPIRMPNSQITRMQPTTCKHLSSCFGIIQIFLGTNIPKEDNLSYLFPIFHHIDEYAFRLLGLDDSDRQSGDESMALSCHPGVLLFDGQSLPNRHMIAFCNGTVSFREPVYVNRHEVEIGHLLEKMGSWRRSGDGDSNRVRKFLSFLGGAEEGIDCRCCIEVCDVLRLEKFPN